LLAVGKRMHGFPWSPLASGSRTCAGASARAAATTTTATTKATTTKATGPCAGAGRGATRRRAARLAGDDRLACVQAREHDVISAVGESQHDWLHDPFARHLFEDDTGCLPGCARGGGRRAPSKREACHLRRLE